MNSELSTCPGFSEDKDVGRAITWRAPLLAAVTAAMALSTGVSASASELATDSTPLAAEQHKPDHGAGVDTRWGDDTTKQSVKALESGVWKPTKDLGSLYSIAGRVGAHDAWRQGVTGKGVTVAVIDTGIAPVEGLNGRGKVTNGPDLSFEGQASGTRYTDGYGHGTHMAGIIAGADDHLSVDRERADRRRFAGVAPEAGLLNMKVATGDGGADVTQVIAAIDWVVQHRYDQGMNVRVINLAYGTGSTQGVDIDPLAHAVENAWRAGIVVVTAAGNDGVDKPSLLMPAQDPYVLAVGAVDHLGTATTADDVVADFSTAGTSIRRPDLIAPGKSVVSLRVPASYADELHPEGRIPNDKGERYFRGSGTSQATAVVSGAVALLLSQRPNLTPDQVKAMLTASADPLSTGNPAQGAGVVDVDGALATATPAAGSVTQTWPVSTGLGSLDASRAGEHVLDPSTGRVLTGEVDALGDPFDAQTWAAASAAGQAWEGGTWGTRPWTGNSWGLTGWDSTTWTGASWSGTSWTDHYWSKAYWNGVSWRDDSWLGVSWRGGTWEARSWRADSWQGVSWRDDQWVAVSWRDGSWEAVSWRDDSWAGVSWRADSFVAVSWRNQI
jgi:serine protease AprX